GEDSQELKREVGIFGSFSMGYADVGADIYVVLGVIALFAGVVSPLAFAIAATTYVCTGLCYAELATAYPVAGGGQYYSLKAFGRIHELKREVGIFGSFSMGYADVGADIYVVLGVIALFAGVVSPLAFAIAATTYVCTGLCYAELATAYPVAGGGQYYSLKAFGRIH